MSLVSKLQTAIDGLTYPSESDELWEVFRSEDCPVEKLSLDELFDGLISASSPKYKKVRKILEDNLTDIQIFKVGDVRKVIYVFGKDADGWTVGLTTVSIET